MEARFHHLKKNVIMRTSHNYKIGYYVLIMTDFFIIMITFSQKYDTHENLSHSYEILSYYEIVSHNYDMLS